MERTQVAIVGGGPAGLVLAHLLHLQGIESVVLEARSREYCEQRIRAGLLEHATASFLLEVGLGERLRQMRTVHHGVVIRFDGRDHRIPISELTGGRTISIYGQERLIADLIEARLGTGEPLLFEAEVVSVTGVETSRPVLQYRHEGALRELASDFVVGCDGFHGVCRLAVPVIAHAREYPLAWLGILAAVPPEIDEIVYAYHERGFALHSVRSPELSRLHLQCRPDEDLTRWPDERIWDELDARLELRDSSPLARGQILKKAVIPLRSFVAEPMRHGRLFLAGDAAHIVPPTGAKGLNLAVQDVRILADALARWHHDGEDDAIEAYSDTCLRNVWRVEQFSWYMTTMLHQFPEHDGFDRRLQRAQLEQLCSSPAAARALAERYVGLDRELALARQPVTMVSLQQRP